MLTWLKNTMIVSLVATAISLVFSVLAGYALARLRFWGGGRAGGADLRQLPGAADAAVHPAVRRDQEPRTDDGGWAINWAGHLDPAQDGPDTYASLFLTYPTFLIPFSSWLLMGYFRSIPKELEESAMIDGSSRLGTLFRVVLPLAAPGLLSAGIFAFTLSWNEYIYSLVFITTTG